MIQLFNINEKFEKVSEYWSPKIAGELNGQYVKLVKAKGEMIWHSHDDEDELFMIFKGTFVMDFRDHSATVPGQRERRRSGSFFSSRKPPNTRATSSMK